MESSRGGPLTTFIMMLPLIIVPAIAMLRPASQEGSLLSELLSAATGEKPTPDSTAESDSDSAEEALEQLFSQGDEDSGDKAFDDSSEVDAELFSEAAGEIPGAQKDAIFDDAPPLSPLDMGTISVADNSIQDSGTKDLLDRLQKMGAVRILWFSPGESQAGFVAFFRAGEGIVSYRFEAVAASRDAAVRDVIGQAEEWMRTSGP